MELRRTRVRTERGEIQQAGDGDDPAIHGIDNIATIELEQRPVLDTSPIGLIQTYQKAIG